MSRFRHQRLSFTNFIQCAMSLSKIWWAKLWKCKEERNLLKTFEDLLWTFHYWVLFLSVSYQILNVGKGIFVPLCRPWQNVWSVINFSTFDCLNLVVLIFGWRQSQPEATRATQNYPEPARATQSQLEPPKNHTERTRASQSQPVANKNLYFILPFLLEHSYLFLWTNYS